MSRYRIILASAAVALLASLLALALSALRDDYSEYCGGIHCVVQYHPDYWQLSASALTVLASLAVVAATFFAARSGDTIQETGQEHIGAMNRQIDALQRERSWLKERISTLEKKIRQLQERDGTNPLDNEPWLSLVEECVEVLDELDEHRPGFDPARRELAEHVMNSLELALEGSGVKVISNDVAFDRARHKPEKASTPASGTTIVETLSPGFAVGPRVLRRARVRLDH